MLVRIWRKGNPPTLLARMWIGATTMENNMEIPQKTENRTTMWSSSHFWAHIKEKKNTNLKEYVHPSVLRAILWSGSMEENSTPILVSLGRLELNFCEHLTPSCKTACCHENTRKYIIFQKSQLSNTDDLVSSLHQLLKSLQTFVSGSSVSLAYLTLVQFLLWLLRTIGLPRWHSGKESACQWKRHKRCGFDPWVGKIPWSRKWQLTPVFLPGKFNGQWSLEGYSLWSHKELDRTEHTHKHENHGE